MKAAAAPMKGQFRAMAAWVEQQLASGSTWLAGDAPGLADIAAYMNFWFLESAAPKELPALLTGLPQTTSWKQRMAALGHGSRAEMTTAEAIEVAAAAEPATDILHDGADILGLAPGAAVAVMADDYGRNPVNGRLLAANTQRIVIAREDARVGRVHVHFPRAGFVVVPA